MGEDLKGYIIRLDGLQPVTRSLVGGKACSISEMKALGVSVPPAFVVSTEVCRYFLERGTLPEGLDSIVRESIFWLEDLTGQQFSSPVNPLLVSVRSGAEISMPGMMDTILNLGMNKRVERGLAEQIGDESFAKDTHARFLLLYSEIVLKEVINSDIKENPDVLKDQIESLGGKIPESGYDQLMAAIEAVFLSWNSRRAKRYRKHNGISDSLGTAVTVQAMVFGNLDDQSGTGVLFSRNPVTGGKEPYGEYLPRAQGEDVVSGKLTPKPIETLEDSNPEVFKELLAAASSLEAQSKEVQDIEFTVERGKLFLLQTRNAKRAPLAALRFAVDFVEEGTIGKLTAMDRLSGDQLQSVSAPIIKDKVLESAQVLLKGEPACPGVGQGVLVTNSESAESRFEKGENIILGCVTTSPEDIHGMIASRALVTESGGSTSHAAVVGRSLGIPTVVKCGEGQVIKLKEKKVTVDGTTGTVYEGYLPLSYPEEDSPYLRKLSIWLTELCPIEVLPLSALTPETVLDLDKVEGGVNLELLPEILKKCSYAKGTVLDSSEGIDIAVRCGIKGILVVHPMSAKLAAIKSRSCG